MNIVLPTLASVLSKDHSASYLLVLPIQPPYSTSLWVLLQHPLQHSIGRFSSPYNQEAGLCTRGNDRLPYIDLYKSCPNLKHQLWTFAADQRLEEEAQEPCSESLGRLCCCSRESEQQGQSQRV